MQSLRAILFTSVLVGLIVGPAISAAQLVGTTPLILKAEVYETAGDQAAAKHDHSDYHGSAAASHEHSHDDGGWTPADGLERNAYSLAANTLTAIGYALVLTGLIVLGGRPVSWQSGLLWGMAGFACVMLAPTLGMPPELPGTPAGPLGDRQLWWGATALATAGGLGLIVFSGKPWGAVLGVLLIAAPHLAGAPLAPEGEHALAPEPLQHQFAVAAVLTSLVFWVLLGSLSGTILRRFGA
jgi:cobalt transporter subunit CbtA